jgi:hypothetical protein
VKAAAMALGLCCCATVQPAIPSSLPFVRVDPALSGAVASEAAAKVFLYRMNAARAEAATAAVASQTEIRVLGLRLKSAENFVQRHAWWAQHGWTVAIGSALIGAATTAAIFLAVIFGGFDYGRK